LHVFAKFFEDRLERRLEAEAFPRREIGGEDDVLDFLIRHFVDGSNRAPSTYFQAPADRTSSAGGN
jgi:hypothetical protein